MTKNRFNLRNRAIIACLAAVTIISGCNKNDDPKENDDTLKIIATDVINASSLIATVKVEAYWYTEDEGHNDVIVQAPYQNNGFTLELPATVSDKYLFLLAEGAPSDMSISDKTVKCMIAYEIEAFDSDENNIGDCYLTIDDKSDAGGVMWVYADKNVTIKGEKRDIYEERNEEYIIKYDIQLKKGWNIVYTKWSESYNSSTKREEYTDAMTMQKPSGVNYQWYYYSYENEADSQSGKYGFHPKAQIFYDKYLFKQVHYGIQQRLF